MKNANETWRLELPLEALQRISSNAKVVAGAEGIDRVIKSINIMEVPDIAQWVKEGELLLSTIYSIKDDEETQRQLIQIWQKGLTVIPIRRSLSLKKFQL